MSECDSRRFFAIAVIIAIIGFWATLITIIALNRLEYFWLMFAVFGASFGLIMLLYSNDKKKSSKIN